MNWVKSFLLVLGCIAGLTIITCKNNAEQADATSGTAVDESQRLLTKEAFAEGIKKRNAVIVDLRYPFEYEQGHIPEAININFFDPQFKSMLLDLDKGKRIYLYGKNENTSYRAMKFLEENEYKHVFHLQGGYKDWNTATE